MNTAVGPRALCNLRSFEFDLWYPLFDESETECVVAIRHTGACSESPTGHSTVLRIHSSCVLGESLLVGRCDCRRQLDASIDLIGSIGCGVLIYILRHDGRGHGIGAQLESFPLMDSGLTASEAYDRIRGSADVRSYRWATAIIRKLGLKEVFLLTQNQEKVEAVLMAGVEIIGTSPCDIEHIQSIRHQLGSRPA